MSFSNNSIIFNQIILNIPLQPHDQYHALLRVWYLQRYTHCTQIFKIRLIVRPTSIYTHVHRQDTEHYNHVLCSASSKSRPWGKACRHVVYLEMLPRSKNKGIKERGSQWRRPYDSGPQPFWHQETVLWKKVWESREGWGGGQGQQEVELKQVYWQPGP